MARAAIPENLHERVRKQAEKGFTTRQIAEWLKDAHGIESSHVTVARLLAAVRKARAPIAQQLVREELEEHVPRDLKRSDEIWDDLDRLQKQAAAVEFEGTPDELAAFKLRQIHAQNRLLETKRRLLSDRAAMAGVVTPGGASGIVEIPAEQEP